MPLGDERDVRLAALHARAADDAQRQFAQRVQQRRAECGFVTVHQRRYRARFFMQGGVRLAEVMPVTGGEIIAEAGQRGDGRVVGAGRVEMFGDAAAVEVMALRLQRGREIGRDNHHAQVRGVGFVGAEAIRVRAQGGEVWPLMRRRRYAVNHHATAVRAAHLDDFRDRIQRADDVGTMRHAHHGGAFIQQPAQVVQRQFAALRVDRPAHKLRAAARA